MWLVVVALAACAPRTKPIARAPQCKCEPTVVVGYEARSYAVNFIPFGAGQFQNGQRAKGAWFATSQAITAGTSAALFVYLSHRYDGYVHPNEASRVRTLRHIEIASGAAFFALAAWGILDALVHYEPFVEIRGVPVTARPRVFSDGAGVALEWSR